jgi:hypothetical protein
LLLPFLDEHALYREYRFDEPWDGPHNSKLADRIPAPFRCPRFVEETGRQKSKSTRLTNYIAISAPHAVFDGNKATRLGDVTDEAANTILVSETRKYSVHWMQPEDVSPDQLFAELQTATYSGSEHVGKCSAIHGLNVLFVDGTVKFLSPQTDSATFRSMILRDENNEGSIPDLKGPQP